MKSKVVRAATAALCQQRTLLTLTVINIGDQLIGCVTTLFSLNFSSAEKMYSKMDKCNHLDILEKLLA
jgi:hypothetical protein